MSKRQNFKKSNCHYGTWSKLGCALALTISTAGGFCAKVPSVSAIAASDCTDIEFIFARGSGEALDQNTNFAGTAGSLDANSNTNAAAWQRSIEKATQDIDLSKSFYNLGSRRYQGYQYPAISLGENLDGYVDMVGAYVSGGNVGRFANSVEQGRQELIYHMIDVMQSCPNTKFVLGGYSQGAMVITKTLNQLYADRILYVATFGDPKLYLPEGEYKISNPFKVPDACRGENLSDYRAYVPDCWAYEGILGSVRPYQPEAYLGKMGTWCNDSDIMCSSGINIDDHSSYISTDLYSNAAQAIREKLKKVYPEKVAANKEGDRNLHDLILLFDITGSMDQWIDYYKKEALRLVKEIHEKGGRVALYTYGDIGSRMFPAQVCDFECSTENLEQAIDRIEVGGGGDPKESMLSAAMYAMNTMDWTFGATKSIVALTDSGYHNPDRDETTQQDVVKRSLEIDPVNIYVLTTAKTASDYQKLTQATGGAVYAIDKGEENMKLSSEQIFRRPVAKLILPEYYGEVDETFTFDAGDSYGFGEEALKFDWDLDGDGVFELINAGAKVTTSYDAPTEHFMQVRTYDELSSSTMSAKVTAVSRVEQKTLPKITTLSAKRLEGEKVEVKFRSTGEKALLAVNDTVLGFVEAKSGENQLTLDELPQESEIRLVPFAASGLRGAAKSVVVGAEVGDESDNNDDDNNDDPNHEKEDQPSGDNKDDRPSTQPDGDNNKDDHPNTDSKDDVKLPPLNHNTGDKKYPLVSKPKDVVDSALAVLEKEKAKPVIPKAPDTGVRSRKNTANN